MLLWYPEDSDILDEAFPIANAVSPTMVLTSFSFASAQVSKSLLNAGPISGIMSEVVVERPYFWKAWWLHCLVREHAPKAATRGGLKLQGRDISKALWEVGSPPSTASSDIRDLKPPRR